MARQEPFENTVDEKYLVFILGRIYFAMRPSMAYVTTSAVIALASPLTQTVHMHILFHFQSRLANAFCSNLRATVVCDEDSNSKESLNIIHLLVENIIWREFIFR